jgi:serine/threonine protein kinase
MVTGLKPFIGDTNTEVLMKIAKGKYPSPRKYNRDIPWQLNRIIKKSMKKDRGKRYHNASEMIRDLNKYIPWHLHTQKKEILAQFLNKFEERSSTTKSISKFQAAGLYSDTSPKFWLSLATLVFLFIFGASQVNRYLLYERFANIEINTNVAACDVYLNDRNIGKISEKLRTFRNILPGDHQLKIIGPDENGIYATNLTLPPGSKTSIAAYIPRRSSSVMLNVKSHPGGAEFFINDRMVGKTPLDNVSIRTGPQEIKLMKEGHRIYEQKYEFTANQSYNLYFNLTAEE